MYGLCESESDPSRLCDRLIDSDFTTIQRRLRSIESRPDTGDELLEPVTGVGGREDSPDISLADYIALVEWTGRIARPDKPGVIVNEQVPVTLIRGPPGWGLTAHSRSRLPSDARLVVLAA